MERMSRQEKWLLALALLLCVLLVAWALGGEAA